MANCLEVEEEATLLQSMGREMWVLVECHHCELAGEGIEFLWGCAKNSYHCVYLKQKQARERQLWNGCKNMPVKRKGVGDRANQTVSRRARSYICAYYMIWYNRQGRGSSEANESALTTNPIKMEKLIIKFKTHRCALDFDHSFCKATFIDLTNED